MTAGESARTKAAELRAEAETLREAAIRWEAGAAGEERVADTLASADPRMTRVLHDRLLDPGSSEANLDHLFVCPSGIYLIDAKNWTGNTTVYNGSLWQHWTSTSGRPSENKNVELHKVRSMAARVSKISGYQVRPVLCLVGDRAERFGEPQDVQGVHVVPVSKLLTWLAQQAQTLTSEQIGSRAVQLSCGFPSAVSPGPTLESVSAGAPVEPSAAQRRPLPHRPPTPERIKRRVPRLRARPLIAIVVLVAFVAALPKLAVVAGHALAHAATASIRTSPAATTPSSTLAPAVAQALDDWRIRAGLYVSNDQPPALRYVPDAALGSWSSECRKQQHTVARYRAGLLKAPDHQLALDAARFDQAARGLLAACVANDPVRLQHAKNAMSAAATIANARYNTLLGKDPKSFLAARVLG